MKLPRPLHSWQLTPAQASALQRRLARRVVPHDSPEPLRYVAGLDAAFSPDGRWCLAGVVLWDLDRAVVVETHLARRRLRFPYVPGLLSFREAPALLAALRRLRHPPDVLLCDGQGVAHPRRFGIASHLGVWLDLPAVGCAKSRLTGTHQEPGSTRGASTALHDGSERIGTVLRTQPGCNPLFVSVGHRISLAQAEELVLRAGGKHRLPEPTHRADRLVAAARSAMSPPPTRSSATSSRRTRPPKPPGD
jgi:deoxyribonuclease V